MDRLSSICEQAHQGAAMKGLLDDASLEKHLVGICGEFDEAISAFENNKTSDRESRKAVDLTQNSVEFVYEYSFHIHNSVEDEIADLFLRTATLIHHLDIPVEILWDSVGSGSMKRASSIYEMYLIFSATINECYLRKECSDTLSYFIVGALKQATTISSMLNFPLEWYIENKLRFNKSRPFMHGKEEK